MINFDDYVNENNGVAFNGIAFKTKHNKNWPYIPDHPYRIWKNKFIIKFNRKPTRH